MSGLQGEFVINDHNAGAFVDKEDQGFAKGLVPRDYSQHPLGSYGSSVPFSQQMDVIPRVELPERIAEMNAKKTRLFDIRETSGLNGGRIPSLDQNGHGFCWAYSVVGCVQLIRAKAGLPFVQLSPHAVACKIFGHQDRGAWGALALDFIADHGVPSDQFWPQKSMSRKHNNAATWENAKRHRIIEGWVDIEVQHASEAQLTFDQVATCLLNRTPVVCDFNWWAHSVFAQDLLDAKPELGQQGLDDPDRFCLRIGNSWTDQWGDRGTAVLQGKKAIPDGACAPRAVMGDA